MITDGRCPTNIQCAATLPVEIALQVGDTGMDATSQLVLSAHTDHDGTVIPSAPGVVTSERYGEYSISLVSVTPYPDAKRATKSSAYKVTLMVSPLTEPARVPADSTPQAPALGAEFTLNAGETIAIAGEDLQFSFDKVVDDIRCPTDVICESPGVVYAQFTAESSGQPPESFTLGGETNTTGAILAPVAGTNDLTAWRYGDFDIELRRIAPYPLYDDAPIPAEDYFATLVVTKAKRPQGQAAPPSPGAAETPTPQATPIRSADRTLVTSLGAPFVLIVGQSALMADEEFTLTFRSAADNSGCFSEDDCSTMTFDGSLALQKGDQKSLAKVIAGFHPDAPFTTDFAGYTVQMLNIRKLTNGAHEATFMVDFGPGE